MNTKIIIIIFVAMVGALLVLGLKVGSLSTPTTSSSDSTISLSTDPNPLKIGPATFVIDVKDKDGKPINNAKVSFDLNMTTMNMGTQKGDAASQGNGKYSVSGNTSMRGPWRVRTKVTMPNGTVENKDFTVNVP